MFKDLLLIILGAIFSGAYYSWQDYKRIKKEKKRERLNKISDKLEQRITTLEKVLESHAKCIGEIREEKDE